MSTVGDFEFWTVWNAGGRTPVVKHDTENSARREAERLAKANPGEEFVVLKAVAVCVSVKPVTWKTLTVDIPF